MDYNYYSDIDSRLLLAQLSVFQVEVLTEILNGSLAIAVSDLVETLETSSEEVLAALEVLLPTKLFQHDGKVIQVDKEKRKFYEYQIQKFDDDFAPDIDYILRGLKRVPIQVLPNWYAIPKTTDDIFASIVEKYFQTPKQYQRHLEELVFDDPIPLAMMRDVYAAEDFVITADALREKYSLPKDQFEAYLLLLEFNFACYLRYAKVGNMWKEVVTPLHEWKELLCFQRDTKPSVVPVRQVCPLHHGGDFAFILDINHLLRFLDEQPLKSDEILQAWTPSLAHKGDEIALTYIDSLVERLLQLRLAEVKEGFLCVTALSQAWLRRTPQDQAASLYRLPNGTYGRFAEKNLRSIEKELRRVACSGWITFDDFCKGMSEPLGEAEPVTLRQKGRRRSYVFPTYLAADIEFVRENITQRFFQAGIVALGSYEGVLCFTVTSYGRLSLGE